VLAEHRIDEPVLGLALDGTGMGTDGTAWGGELLMVDGARCDRLGHLRPIVLPGGDRAAQEPWRMGAAALALLGRHDEIPQRYADQPGVNVVTQMLARELPMTTSMGRWFDAAAGLLGIQPRMSFEGQAAMRLEGLAEAHGKVDVETTLYSVGRYDNRLVLDLLPLLAQMLSTHGIGHAAALFHAALVQGLADWVQAAADASGIRTVACGGGCFINALLTAGLRDEFSRRGLRMLEAQAAPPGDGGLALGQAWVAMRSPDAAKRNPG
jgi:hydrogenase maturation protein HypF